MNKNISPMPWTLHIDPEGVYLNNTHQPEWAWLWSKEGEDDQRIITSTPILTSWDKPDFVLLRAAPELLEALEQLLDCSAIRETGSCGFHLSAQPARKAK